MAKSKFSLLDTMNKASIQELRQPPKEIQGDGLVWLSVHDLTPSEGNFYGMTGLEELKENIQIAGKVLQNLIVTPTEGGKYKILSGHRRCVASLELVAEGKVEFEKVPCSIEEYQTNPETQELREEIVLITSNSQREKTGWEKVEEARRIRNILENIKSQGNAVGSIRDGVAEMLNTSPTQVARYDAIYKNLTPAFMSAFREEKINLSTAYELSGLDMESQTLAYQVFQKTGKLTLKETKGMKEAKAPKPKAKKPTICDSCEDIYYRQIRTVSGDREQTEYVEYRPQFCPQCGRAKE